MTVNIEAALEERELLIEELNSLVSLISDKENPLPHLEMKKAIIRFAVQTNSVRFVEKMISDELAKVPLFLFYGNPTNDEA